MARARWSPYVVGAGIGVLSWVTFGLMGKALGVSTTFVRAVGVVESIVAADHVRANSYLAKYVVEGPAVDWQMLLVVGLFAGAWLSSKLGGSYQVERVPQLWAWRFGARKWARYAGAFVGGVLVLSGSRLAGGCTSGHGISGGLQFAAASWVFLPAFFAAGVVTAFALFGREGRRHV